MNFFDAQDRARRSTAWLVVVYGIATILIVAGVTLVVGVSLNAVGLNDLPANPRILVFTAAATTLFIFGATLYKTTLLSSGGSRVAQDVGGTPVAADVTDPLRRRLRNVVEEMAIASGLPVPEIYVLEQEGGINAFAAGYTPGDAAVAVTRGTLELLDRDELQGVIAHEFSHILNGDMRLNIRLMGVLYGIMVLGLIGRMILRGSYRSGVVSSRRKGGSGGVVFVGLGLLILGWIGVLFARIIKAAVSRQRELLADASAVQFTRQTDGIANALKKIGGFAGHSYIKNTDPEEISHMLFEAGVRRLSTLFATHPPLIERIRALDPAFRASDYPLVDVRRRSTVETTEPVAGFADAGTDSQVSADITGDIAAAVGRPAAQHVAYAKRLRGNIPKRLNDAAHAPDEAFLLTVALVIDERQADRQLHLVEEQLGKDRAATIKSYIGQIAKLGPRFRLPLLEIAFPMLKARPRAQIEYLLHLVRRLIEIDSRISLREFCMYRVLASQLNQATAPSAHRRRNRVPRRKARRAALDLVRIVADLGNEDDASREHAFRAGIANFGAWTRDEELQHAGEDAVRILSRSLDILRGINSAGRKSLLQAVSNTISHDGKLTLSEAELLRAICATLDCPLPPIAVS